ncbi:Cytidine and dCMP deaminase domain-containing protein 1 [Oryzias melastigma]|uniref:Cytidine and dCMP deaminase domain-containing protein 1 n=1 Tax=Oryzias melastigma TaxID=30732 RepID=A0A834C2Z1_ORYME|nr:Cytidine and dCMP deaminase domain-containing protein 1 [Oryzias melastigma]
MEGGEKRNRNEPSRPGQCRETKDGSTQTDCRIQGHGPRLSKVNLFTLLSLWMEMFPREEERRKKRTAARSVWGQASLKSGITAE